jgi:hypothetical protein
MSASEHQDAINAYVKDYECLMEGVEYFFQLEQLVVQNGNIQAIKQHYDSHPEDKLCQIYRPEDRSPVLCRRAGIEAIHRMAHRLVGEAPNGSDLSAEDISTIISEKIVQAMIDRVTDDDELVKILKSYVSLSEAKHARISHHFPCVVVHPQPNHPIAGGPPTDKIVLGPVAFRRLPHFLDEVNRSIDLGEKQLADDKGLKYFVESAQKHGWVASVEIPSCAPDISRQRAETIIEAAINLLKIFIGLRHANAMRLPHTAAVRNHETCVLNEIDGKLEWTWHGRGIEGALVENHWFASIPEPYLNFASHLLVSCLSGKRSEATNRLVDALKWFGDAAFESSSGVQIAKWVAALERLTTTGQFITHVFCVRVALLTGNPDADSMAQAYKNARKAYQLRCDVMHGSRSQDDLHLAANAGFVHDLTRTAIFRALEMHTFLDAVKGDAQLTSIAKFYEDNTRRFATQFEQLRASRGISTGKSWCRSASGKSGIGPA